MGEAERRESWWGDGVGEVEGNGAGGVGTGKKKKLRDGKMGKMGKMGNEKRECGVAWLI